MARFYHYKNNSIPHKTRFGGNSLDTLSKSSLEVNVAISRKNLSLTNFFKTFFFQLLFMVAECVEVYLE